MKKNHAVLTVSNILNWYSVVILDLKYVINHFLVQIDVFDHFLAERQVLWAALSSIGLFSFFFSDRVKLPGIILGEKTDF